MSYSTLQIEPSASKTLGLKIEELKKDPEGAEVFTALLKALVGFRNYDFRESFPKFYSVSGNVYVYRFHPNYVLIFTRRLETLPDQPERVILELGTIQKA